MRTAALTSGTTKILRGKGAAGVLAQLGDKLEQERLVLFGDLDLSGLLLRPARFEEPFHKVQGEQNTRNADDDAEARKDVNGRNNGQGDRPEKQAQIDAEEHDQAQQQQDDAAVVVAGRLRQIPGYVFRAGGIVVIDAGHRGGPP